MTTFQDVVEYSLFDCRSYSGRGMYGKKCLGIELDRYATLGTFFAEILVSMEELRKDEEDPIGLEVAAAFRNMQTDSMGLGMIVYFPGIPFEQEDEE